MQCNHSLVLSNVMHKQAAIVVQALGDDEMLDLQSNAPVKPEQPSADFMLS